MTDYKKNIFNIAITIVLGIIGWNIRTMVTKIETNTKYSIEYHKEFEKVNSKIIQLEKDIDKMPDTYVTRRELDIRLQNIDTKIGTLNQEVGSIGNDVKDMNSKFDRLLEKIYDK